MTSSILLAYLAIFTPVLAAGLLGGWVACRLWDWHRDRKPVPYLPTDQAIDALASSVQCTWCTPAPRGLCSCTVRCGHIRCVHLPGRGWTSRDREEILEGKKLP